MADATGSVTFGGTEVEIHQWTGAEDDELGSADATVFPFELTMHKQKDGRWWWIVKWWGGGNILKDGYANTAPEAISTADSWCRNRIGEMFTGWGNPN